MKKLFVPQKLTYDGSQLKPLYAYENHKMLGDSIISWIGSCNITLDHMVDLEDKNQNAKICGDEMLHFIVEVFGPDLTAGVALQRLFASMAKDKIEVLSWQKLVRDGDDLYSADKKNKLSISIASKSAVSTMIHFAMNITNNGTPVPTLSLQDLKVDPTKLAEQLMNDFASEYESIVIATQKVIPL